MISTSLNLIVKIQMKLILFKIIAKLNKLLLPSLSKRRIDLTKITFIEKIVLGWKLYITKKVINQ